MLLARKAKRWGSLDTVDSKFTVFLCVTSSMHSSRRFLSEHGGFKFFRNSCSPSRQLHVAGPSHSFHHHMSITYLKYSYYYSSWNGKLAIFSRCSHLRIM